jgi:radical SAM superfamily enzyme YgiQ (UPF0313 family)
MPLPRYEVGPIRPPSEAQSLLIRATRNCPWNKCEFCPIYKRHVFQKRPVEDIIRDIDTAAAVYGDIYHSAFLQDANSLLMKTEDLIKVISRIKEKFPAVERVTSYGRARTAARKSVEDLQRLFKAGLTRLHIGLETGYDALLEYMKKGMTAEIAVEGGRRIKESGISLCFYIIIGLGGRLKLEGEGTWKKHALETARVLNSVDPDFIRVRTLTIRDGCPLFDKVERGEFEEADDAELVKEEQLLIESLKVTSRFVSDHSTNILMDVKGKLPEDKEKMLSITRRYLELTEDEQLNFRLGTLFRYFAYSPCYRSFEDFFDLRKRTEITAVIAEMEAHDPGSARTLVERLQSMLV